MKVLKTKLHRVLSKSVQNTALSRANNNRSYRWSREWKSSHNSNATSTRTSRASERRKSPSVPNPALTDTGTHGAPTRETVWSIRVSQETTQESCSHLQQASLFYILLNHLPMELFTLSITTISSGRPCTSSSPRTDQLCRIKPSQELLDHINQKHQKANI